MELLRLYRRFYKIEKAATDSSETYSLIDPTQLTAKTFVRNTTNEIEDLGSPQKDSSGIYYVNLNPKKYSIDLEYDVHWYVTYISIAPIKRLLTTFKLIPQILSSGQIEYNLDYNNNIEFEINDAIDIEIEN